MLRPIQSEHMRPRIVALKIDTSSGTPSASIGAGNLTALQDNGGGDTTVTFKKTFHQTGGSDRALVTILSPDTNTAFAQTYANSITQNRLLGSNDGIIYAMMAGLDGETQERVLPLQQVKVEAKQSVLLGFKVTGTGTAAINIGGSQGTLTDNGTGDYTIAITVPFGRAPIAVACTGTVNTYARVTAATASSITVKTFNTSSSATDAIFYLFVMGWRSSQEDWGRSLPLMTPQKDPRMYFYNILNTAGTPTLGIGANQGTIVDNGTGDYTITFAKAFRRAPIVVATAYYNGSANGIAYVISASTTAVNVGRIITTGPAADDGNVDLWVLGFDDPDEK